jgi:hypothetical protein
MFISKNGIIQRVNDPIFTYEAQGFTIYLQEVIDSYRESGSNYFID